MNSAIIKSESRLKRYPVLAFIMSFIFTGLGQIYNGDISKGFVFFILRILSIVLIPVYVILQNSFSIIIIIAAAAIHVLVWIVSTGEALYSTKGKHAYNLKKYNTILFYIFFILLNTAIMMFSVFLITSLFFVNKIRNDNMNPLLLTNDYIFINKYAVKDTGIGDIICFTSKNEVMVGRIIAGDADMISKKGAKYYINDAALSYNIISKSELEKMGIPVSDDIFFEINGEKKYPVKFLPDKIKNAYAIEAISLSEGEFLIAFDNRDETDLYELVSLNSIIGRVEGIIYSDVIKRVFNTIYLQEKISSD